MNLDRIDTDALRAGRGAKWSDVPTDVLPAWVADMDFPVAEPITRVLQSMLSRSDFGYPAGPKAGGLPAIFARRMTERFGWAVDPAGVEILSDVVQGLHLAIELFSEAGDPVVTPVPIYPPFLTAVRATRRIPVLQHFVRTPQGWRVDLERLRADLPSATRMLLVCNPHNPTGHALTTEELEALAAIAIERDLVVVSDEIHGDLVYPGARHVAIATLGPEIAARTITLTSATKAFNIAGLRCAVAVFGTPEMRRRFNSFHPHGRGGLAAMGLAATEVAWRECQDWQDQVLAYLLSNRDFLFDHVHRNWPAVVHERPEAGYLAWLDFRSLALAPSPRRFFFERARVALSDGEDFGAEGRGFVRLNFATSREVLEEILRRMDAALAERA